MKPYTFVLNVELELQRKGQETGVDYAPIATLTRWNFNFVKPSLQIFINQLFAPTLLVIDSVGVLFPRQVDKMSFENDTTIAKN